MTSHLPERCSADGIGVSLPWDHPRRLLRRGWRVLGRDEGGPSRAAAGHRAATPQAPLTARRPRPVRLGEPRPPHLGHRAAAPGRRPGGCPRPAAAETCVVGGADYGRRGGGRPRTHAGERRPAALAGPAADRCRRLGQHHLGAAGLRTGTLGAAAACAGDGAGRRRRRVPACGPG